MLTDLHASRHIMQWQSRGTCAPLTHPEIALNSETFSLPVKDFISNFTVQSDYVIVMGY